MFATDHIALMVEDLEKSGSFYGKLGGHLVSKKSDRFREYLLGDLRLHLVGAYRNTRTDDKAGSRDSVEIGIHHFCLRVESVKALTGLRDHLRVLPEMDGQNLDISISPPMGSHSEESVEEFPPVGVLYARDPDGNIIEFRSY